MLLPAPKESAAAGAGPACLRRLGWQWPGPRPLVPSRLPCPVRPALGPALHPSSVLPSPVGGGVLEDHSWVCVELSPSLHGVLTHLLCSARPAWRQCFPWGVSLEGLLGNFPSPSCYLFL